MKGWRNDMKALAMTARKRWDDLIPPERRRFATRLKARRKELGLTQAAIYDKTGIAISYISNLEKGDVNPSLDIMASLARALDVDLTHFFDETPKATD